MTPERLQEIRNLVPKNPDGRAMASRIVNELLDYIDQLEHETIDLAEDLKEEKAKRAQESKEHTKEVLRWDELVSLKSKRIDALTHLLRNQTVEIEEIRKDTK